MRTLLRSSWGQVTLVLAGFALLLVAVAAVVELISLHDQGGYRVTATIGDVNGLFDHQTVRLDGVEVGQVDTISPNPRRGVDVTLSIDPRYGPLHQGAQISVRSLGLFAEQYVKIVDGPSSAAPLPDGAGVPLSQSASAIGLDSVVDALDTATRAEIRTLITQAQTGLAGSSAADLNAALQQLHLAVEALDPAMATLSQRTAALDAMISDYDQLATKAASDRAGVARAVSDLNQGLATFDSHSGPVGRALQQAATSMTTGTAIVGQRIPELRSLFTELPGTLRTLDSLLSEVNPFLANLEPLAPQIRQLLVGLQRSAAGADQNGNYIRVLPQLGEASFVENIPGERVPDQPFPPGTAPSPPSRTPGQPQVDPNARLWGELFR
ncbi:MAG TPA: MlaD family protein [Candidatus Dormibacteraeota bacterium]|nr:MlaD family protein [Candidatus Dormibacteraeota bacterium]